MKFFSKIAAILAALMLACAFVACSNDTSSGGAAGDASVSSNSIDPSATLIATFSGTLGSDSVTLRFYNNNQLDLGLYIGTWSGANPSGTSGTGSFSFNDTAAGSQYNGSYSISGSTMTCTGGWNGTLTRQ